LTVASSPVVFDTTTRRGRSLAPILIYGGLLGAIVSSLGAPLVPTIAEDYRVSLGSAQWSLTIALLVAAIAAPVLGRLGDGPGRRRVTLAAFGVVVIGCILAGLPTNAFAVLLVGRAAQGVGLATLPLMMSLARDHLDTDRSRSTLATLSVTQVVGVGLGYPLTGILAEHVSFRAGFWLAAVLGAVAMILLAVSMPASNHQPRQSFDALGATVLGLGLGALLVSIGQGEEWGWGSARILGLAVGAVALLTIGIWHELRTTTPMVNLRLMRSRPVLTANVTGILAGIGMYMLMSMIIRFVQTPTTLSYGLGASVVVSGLVLVPMSAASFLSSKIAIVVSRWMAPARLLPLGMLMFAVALALFATCRGALWEIFIEMAIGGVAIGCSFVVMPRLIVSSTPSAETASALALNQVLRTLGYSIGSALAGTVLTAHTPTGDRFPSNQGYTVGALIAIGLCLATAVISWVLPTWRHPDRLSADDSREVDESVDSAIAGVIGFEPEPPRPNSP
jgi:MFS family permease